ncbi:MAG: hypothetical protein IKW30_10105 [Lachnospiraceae bacterium]|nr:hypothetical protein [Lachnospiraceae bacterium]
MRDFYKKSINFLDSKKIGIIVGILFLLSLLPIIYVGMYNYATGDDYWYGLYTHRGWVEHGFIGAIKGAFETVAIFYKNWQGTWFTVFLFSLAPSNFVEGTYWITVFIALGMTIGSFAYLANYYLVNILNFTRGAMITIVCMISYLGIQYMYKTTSGLYWFNGVMHYCVPFFLGALAIVHTHKFVREKKKKDYVVLFLAFTLLGGSSYLAPITASLTAVLILLSQIKIRKCEFKNKKFSFDFDKRNLWVLAALMAEVVGLLISFLSPGNSVRGTEEFGFDLKWALECIYYAIDRGIYLGEDYFLKNGVTTMMYVLIFFLLWSQLWRCDRENIKFRYPLFYVVFLNGIYWSSYTPEIYSRSDVSGGVHNTYLHVFLIVTLGCMIFVHGWAQDKLVVYWKKKAEKADKSYEEIRDNSIFYEKKYKTYIMAPILAVGIIILGIVMCFSKVSTTNKACMEYAKSGRMEQYAQVRQEQHKILSDEAIEDALVPEMGDQYPLLNMYMRENADDSRNIDRALYYGKKSVRVYMVE